MTYGPIVFNGDLAGSGYRSPVSVTVSGLKGKQLPTLSSGYLRYDTNTSSWSFSSSTGLASNIAGGNSTTLLGSIPYQSNTDTTTLLAPNTSTTKKYLSQTGTGTNGAPPVWSTIDGLDSKLEYHGVYYDGSYEMTMSYNASTRTLTLTPTGSSYRIWIDGVLYTFTGVQSIQHSNIEGPWFIYYNGSGVLTASQTPWSLLSHAPIAQLYYDATNVEAIVLEERHHHRTPKEWHNSQHWAIGTFVKDQSSDFVLGGYTLNSATDSAITWSLGSGTVIDEDIHMLLSAITDGGPYQTWYKSGASGYWRRVQRSFPVHYSGTVLQYNQNTGSTWQLTNMTDGDWVNYYIMGVPALDSSKQILIIPGQTTFSSLTSAQAERIGNLDLTMLISQEYVPLYQISLRYRSSYSNTVRCRIEAVSRLEGTRSSVQLSGSAPTLHGALSGRDLADQHPATAITFPTSGSLTLSGVSNIDHLSTLSVGPSSATTINVATASIAQTVNIGYGGAGATTINIGGSGDSVLIGSPLAIVDKLVTLNSGGGSASGTEVGLEVEESSIAVAYIKTSADRNSWTLKSPTKPGKISFTPSSVGDFNATLVSTATADRTYNLPDISGTLVVTDGTQTFQGSVSFLNNIIVNGVTVGAVGYQSSTLSGISQSTTTRSEDSFITGPPQCFNVNIGYGSLDNNALGSCCVATGWFSQPMTSAGIHNVSYGTVSMRNNIAGSYNSAVGSASLFDLTQVSGVITSFTDLGSGIVRANTTTTGLSTGHAVALCLASGYGTYLIDSVTIVPYGFSFPSAGLPTLTSGEWFLVDTSSMTTANHITTIQYNSNEDLLYLYTQSNHNLSADSSIHLFGTNGLCDGSFIIVSAATNVFTIKPSIGRASIPTLINIYTTNVDGWWSDSPLVSSSNTAIGYNTGRGIVAGSNNTIVGANVAGLDSNLSNNIILATGDGDIKLRLDGTQWTLKGDLQVSGSISAPNQQPPAVVAVTNGYVLSGSLVTNSTSTVTLDSYQVNATRSAEYLISMQVGGSSHVTKLLVTHDGTTPFMSCCGMVISNISLADFSVSISNGNLVLSITPAISSATTIKFIRTCVNV